MTPLELEREGNYFGFEEEGGPKAGDEEELMERFIHREEARRRGRGAGAEGATAAGR